MYVTDNLHYDRPIEEFDPEARLRRQLRHLRRAEHEHALAAGYGGSFAFEMERLGKELRDLALVVDAELTIMREQVDALDPVWRARGASE